MWKKCFCLRNGSLANRNSPADSALRVVGGKPKQAMTKLVPWKLRGSGRLASTLQIEVDCQRPTSGECHCCQRLVRGAETVIVCCASQSAAMCRSSYRTRLKFPAKRPNRDHGKRPKQKCRRTCLEYQDQSETGIEPYPGGEIEHNHHFQLDRVVRGSYTQCWFLLALLPPSGALPAFHHEQDSLRV